MNWATLRLGFIWVLLLVILFVLAPTGSTSPRGITSERVLSHAETRALLRTLKSLPPDQAYQLGSAATSDLIVVCRAPSHKCLSKLPRETGP